MDAANDGAGPGGEGAPARAAPGRWHRALLGLGLVALGVLAVRGARKAAREGSDLAIYLAAGRAVLAGEDPLAVEDFIYLPAFAIVVAPLAALSSELAAVLWTLVGLGAYLLALRSSVRLAAGPARAPPWLAWATLFATLRLVDSNLAYGQVNLITLGLAVGGYAALASGREHSAGLLIGTAAALKVLPGLLLVHLALTRRWRAFSVGGVWALVVAVGLPAVVAGPADALDGLARWFQSEAWPYLQGGEALVERRGYVPGHSLTAALYRALAPIPATSKGALGPTANLAELDLATVAGIVRIVVLGHLLVFAGLALRGGRRDLAGSAALAMASALVAGPLVHKAHLVWLTPGLAVLFARAGRRGRAASGRIGLVRALLGFAVAALALTGDALLGSLARDVATYNVLSLGLWCAWLGLAIRSQDRIRRLSVRPAPVAGTRRPDRRRIRS